MSNDDRKPVLTRIQDLLNAVDLSRPAYRPGAEAGAGMEIVGTATPSLRRLWVAREQLQHATTAEQAEYNIAGDRIAEHIGPAEQSAHGLVRMVELFSQQAFKDEVQKFGALEAAYIASAHTLAVVRALYTAEMHQTFPQVGTRRVSVDPQWRIFHDPKRGQVKKPHSMEVHEVRDVSELASIFGARRRFR